MDSVAASGLEIVPRLSVENGRHGSLQAGIGMLKGFDERPVAWFRGVIGTDNAPVVARLVETAMDAGVPLVGVVEQIGLEARPQVDDHGQSNESRRNGAAADRNGASGQAPPGAPAAASLALLDGWGNITRGLAKASGVIPTVLVLDGPCLGGPALAVGLVDVVIMTSRSELFVNQPEASMRITGTDDLDAAQLGGLWPHLSSSGIADLAAEDVDEALGLAADVLAFLPSNCHEPPPDSHIADPVDRPASGAAAVVPGSARASYDVRDVIYDLVDDGHFTELRATYGKSLVVGLGRLGGLPVGVVANQPSQLAGALDIDSSTKGARFVRWCDSFNVPLLTLVDTPGFRPGRDQEWQGIVRHGAKLAFAYAEAVVPRVSVVLRKAYGGAYIVMDCKAMGSDCALAWPQAEVAVMGASAAVGLLHRRTLAEAPLEEQDALREELEAAYAEEHLSPRIAAQRGFIDEVIEPVTTRRVLVEAFAALASKVRTRPKRRHDNIPL